VRSATLLGVFGLGGLGNELKLTLESLEFHQLWSGLWLLLAVMLSLETAIGVLRRRWSMPGRFGLAGERSGNGSVGQRGREILLTLTLLLPAWLLAAGALAVDPADLLRWQPLPPLAPQGWATALALPWPTLVSDTLTLTLLAAGLAVGGAPLLLLLVAPWPWGRRLLQLVWAFGRLWPPPLTALLLLFVLKPGVITAALALGFHNLGILGRLLLEGSEVTGPEVEQALQCDVILRETVVVGLVAGSGLGSQLRESLSAFAWDQLALLLAVYALLTLVGEDLSDRARQRLLGVA